MLKRLFAIFAAIMLSAAIAFAVTATVDDIIKLHREGLSVDIIKAFINSSGQKFELSAEDILRMKKAGVPEEIIELMIKTSQPLEAAPPPSGGTVEEGGEVEPRFEYKKRYHSVFSFQVYKKQMLGGERVLAVGKRDPLRNTAKRGGTLFLTDEQMVMFDMEGDERFRLNYTDITVLKIETRYPDAVAARYHPLDTYVLWIFFKKDGQEFYAKIFTLPRPEKKKYLVTYGSVKDIATEIQSLGKGANPKLAGPIKRK